MFRRLAYLLRPRLCSPETVLGTPTPSLLHLKSLSSTPNSVSSKDYLASSLPLPPESAQALKFIKCKPIAIRCISNADSMVSLFKSYGFSHTHIVKIFSLCPNLLNYDPIKSVKPKLDFLAQSGVSADVLVHFISNGPKILQRSLQKQIAPSVNFLNTFFANDHQTMNSFLSSKRTAVFISVFSETATPANVEAMRRLGVPDSNILKFARLGGGPQALAHDADYFNGSLNKAVDMGFDPRSLMFIYGLRVVAGMSDEKWVSKMELIKKCFGWTDDRQVLALVTKQSTFMGSSEEKLKQCLDVFMNRLGWAPDYIARYPAVLTCSFSKRIFPRISVLEILASRGLVKMEATGRAFLVSEDTFLSLYVDEYQQDLPQLMEIYTKTMSMGIL